MMMMSLTSQELLLNGDSLDDDVLDNIRVRATLQMSEEQASKVGVHALVTADELVGECKTRHQATLLHPEDGGERAREEDSLNGGECDKTLSEGRLLVRDPTEGPVSLALDARNGLDGVEQEFPTSGVLDVGVDEERVGLGVDVLHHNLEAVEATSFSRLDFVGETLNEVLVDNAVGCSEEREDVGEEVALVIVQAVVPVVHVLGQVHLFGGPEGGLSLLVHLPNLSER